MSKDSHKLSVFVRGIDARVVNENALRSHFKQAGNIHSVKLVRSWESSNGHDHDLAFVDFTTEGAAARAVANLHNSILNVPSSSQTFKLKVEPRMERYGQRRPPGLEPKAGTPAKVARTLAPTPTPTPTPAAATNDFGAKLGALRAAAAPPAPPPPVPVPAPPPLQPAWMGGQPTLAPLPPVTDPEKLIPFGMLEVDIADWSEHDVAIFLDSIGFPSQVCKQIVDNLVNGGVLLNLTADEMMQELHLSRLQAKRLEFEVRARRAVA
tara:strand:+ start:123 stop:920 length:798 start_codon:yes stop_codon:yes gene_type:complete